MATISQNPPGTELSQLEESEAKAWRIYSKSLEGLTGADYSDAEDRSWERLQRKLGQIESRRAEIGSDPKRNSTRDGS